MTGQVGTDAIIGREHPSAVVRADIARLVDSHGGLLLVTGEAGIGKTTLVSEAAEHARQAGAMVLSGSCWESARAPDYWPWVQVIRALRRALPADEWSGVATAAGPALATLLGEAAFPSGPPGPSLGFWPEGAEPADIVPDAFRLADAVTTALVFASQTRPIMVILDDLHWADPASLRLLEFAGQHTWFERLLLAGTYRDVEVDTADGPHRSLLAPIVAKATTVTLTGLGRDEVAALIERVAGRTPEPAVAEEVHRRTGGNPFFVEQTARLWQVEGALGTVPPGVRDAVRRRVALLPEPVVDLLVAASVLGQDFDRAVLAASVDRDPSAVDDSLAVAVTARLVAPSGPGRLAFTHDLVRETLYGGMSDSERRRRHSAVVRAVADDAGTSRALLPADLARHADRAGNDLPVERAIELLLAAARDASERLASQEAASHYRRALDRVGHSPRRARIALDLGLELEHGGNHEEGRRFLNEAAEIALAEDDPRLLARVALTAHRHRSGMPGAGSGAFRGQSLLQEAHRRLVGDDQGLSDDEMFRNLIGRTELIARQDADDDALSFSLWTRHDELWGLGTAAERMALTTEMREVARRAGDRDRELFGVSLACAARLELGDPAYLDEFNAFVSAAERVGLPRYHLSTVVDRGIIAAFRGDFERAEALHQQLIDLGDHGSFEFAYMTHHLRWALSLLRGHYDRIDEQLAGLTKADHPYLDLVIAITAAERGRVEQARWQAQRIRARVDTYPRYMTPLLLRLQAQVAAATRDETWADQVRRALEPHRGEWLVSLFGCDISGPVEHWLALLDAAAGRWGDAARAAGAAVEAAERMGSRPWALKARALLAEALTEQEPSRARHEASVVEHEARALGLAYLTASALPAPPPPSTSEVSAGPEFRLDGVVWRLGYDGAVVHMPDAKGLRDLHALLSQPYEDLSAVLLLEPAGGAEVVAARGLGGDPVLDEEAKARYRARLSELDNELDRAGRRGDAVRGAALERERDALLTELRRAVGLGGRSRRLGDEAERARKAVTARIRDTLRKLDERHPALAEHLRATVSTGSTCRYSPGETVRWLL